ncbi:hypothetical protein [Halomonas sp.]|uniref:hypothetical protein n=1 Tax=Halomonas sp. TaxID=1486246 RepID=UPI0035678457
MARHDFRRGCLVGNLGQEANVSIERISVRAIPLVGSMVVIDLVLAFFPQISLWLTTLLGF